MRNKTERMRSINNKIRKDLFFKSIVFCFSILSASAVIWLLVYLINGASPAFNKSNFFELSKNHFHIWASLINTVLIATLSLLIAVIVGTKTAFFIHFRLKNEKMKSFTRFIIEILTGIPSVVYGIIGAMAFGPIINKIFNTQNEHQSVIAAIMVLFIMILPTITSFTLNALKNLDKKIYQGAISLGVSIESAKYIIVKKAIRSQRMTGIIIAFSRAIGETMAISIILTSSPTTIFSHGMFSWLRGFSGNLATLIPGNFFPDSSSLPIDVTRGFMYFAGIIIFVFIIIINLIIMKINRDGSGISWRQVRIKFNNKMHKKTKKQKYLDKAVHLINLKEKRNLSYEVSKYSPKKFLIKIIYYLSFFTTSKILRKKQKNEVINIIKNQYTIYKIFVEIINAIFAFGIVMWIVSYITYFGGKEFSFSHLDKTSNGGDNIGSALQTTLMLIGITILIVTPFALLLGVYLSEYANRTKVHNKILIFMIDALGGAPSIIFGMFGYMLFIKTLHITPSYSILVGALTMIFVVLPTFSRSIEQAFIGVPKDLRVASYALGAGKFETFKKIVLPNAINGIVTSVIMTIGRIVAETAPVYLVMGLGYTKYPSINSGSLTLTTRTYIKYTNSDVVQGPKYALEAAFVSMIMIITLMLAAYFVGYIIYKRREIINSLKKRKEV